MKNFAKLADKQIVQPQVVKGGGVFPVVIGINNTKKEPATPAK